jgi:hypothetical protein
VREPQSYRFQQVNLHPSLAFSLLLQFGTDACRGIRRKSSKEETKMARPMPRPEYVAAEQHTDYVKQAYTILKFGFTVAPIIAGLDKFFNLLVDWTQYLTPLVPAWTGIDPAVFMMVIGVVEIIAGIVVAVKPKFGGLLVAAWLWGIILNLLLVPGYFDVALRDLGLSFGALALAALAAAREE